MILLGSSDLDILVINDLLVAAASFKEGHDRGDIHLFKKRVV